MICLFHDQLYLGWVYIKDLHISDRGSHIINCTLDRYLLMILPILDTGGHLQALAEMSIG